MVSKLSIISHNENQTAKFGEVHAVRVDTDL